MGGAAPHRPGADGRRGRGRLAPELDKQRERPEQARYIVGKDILPMIGNVPLAALKKSDCKAVIARVTARGATVHTGEALTSLGERDCHAVAGRQRLPCVP